MSLGNRRSAIRTSCGPATLGRRWFSFSITSAGAGLCLLPGEATADAVRDAASRLLDENSFRQAASQIGRSIAHMPSVEEVTGVLERLV